MLYVVQQGHGDDNKAWLGVSVEEETERPDGGARVTWVIDDSPAARLGLQRGDIIVSLDGKRVYGPGGLTEAIRSHDPGASVEVEIVRDGQNQALTVELGERPDSWSVRVRGQGDHEFHFQLAEEQFAKQMEQMRMSLERSTNSRNSRNWNTSTRASRPASGLISAASATGPSWASS